MPTPAMDPADPVALTRALIRCRSVTPDDGGAIAVLEAALAPLGFVCHRVDFQEPGTEPVTNLYARLGTEAPHLAFAGHTDVVPPGDAGLWHHDPFAAVIEDGILYGRGAADMKGGIAAFVAAVARHLQRHGPPRGSTSLLITGDEEGPAVNGTRKLLEWIAERGERIDACLVGEPTSPERLGEMIKIGRRGSLSARIVVTGIQGHTAYPHRADNPVHRLIAGLHALLAAPLDDGSEHFEPSTLQITSVDVGNPAGNVIPARAEARLNIRFNDRHTRESLEAWLRQRLRAAGRFELGLHSSGDAFLTGPGPLTEIVAGAVEEVTGARPVLGTSGGTSDARFIKDYCPVVEIGGVGASMHQVDEHVRVDDLLGLTDIYAAILRRYFEAG